MRIAEVRPLVLGTAWRNLAFVVVRTDEGLEGVGEVRMLNQTDALLGYLGQIVPVYVLGSDPFAVEALVQRITRDEYTRAGVISMSALSVLETDAGTSSARRSASPCAGCSAARFATRSRRMPTAGTRSSAPRTSFTPPRGLAACTPNFKIQEHFNDFADPWVKQAAPGNPEVICELGRELSRLDRLLGSQVRARAAIILDWESWWALELDTAKPLAELRLLDQVAAFYRPLHSANVAVDFAPPDADLTPYRLVLVPHLYLLSGAAASNLEQFAAGGGTLVVSLWSGIVDTRDHVFAEGYAAPLRRVLGLAVRGGRHRAVRRDRYAGRRTLRVGPLERRYRTTRRGGDRDLRPTGRTRARPLRRGMGSAEA